MTFYDAKKEQRKRLLLVLSNTDEECHGLGKVVLVVQRSSLKVEIQCREILISYGSAKEKVEVGTLMSIQGYLGSSGIVKQPHKLDSNTTYGLPKYSITLLSRGYLEKRE